MSWHLGCCRVLRGTLTVPSQGAWRASLDLDADALVTLGQRATLTAGDVDYSGTVRALATDGGRMSVDLIGGAGGLRTELPARSYYQVTAGGVARDIAVACGETVDSATEQALGAILLPSWSRDQGEAGRAWQALADELGLSWWVTPAGGLSIGTRVAGEYGGDVIVIESDDRLGLRVLAVADCSAAPGQTLDGLVADSIEFAVGPEGERLTVYGRGQGAALADATGPARDMARLARTSTARVAATHADGTVDLVPDDDRLRGQGIQRVPVWLGVPGSVSVPVGARVGLIFANGKRSEPVACLFAGDDLTELSLGSGSGGYVALASLVSSQLSALVTAISTAAVGSADGGALFKANLLANLASWPGNVAAGKVKAE